MLLTDCVAPRTFLAKAMSWMAGANDKNGTSAVYAVAMVSSALTALLAMPPAEVNRESPGDDQ